MMKWIRNWFGQRQRITELEQELEAAECTVDTLSGRVERLIAHERPLRMARTKYRREVRRLNMALRVRSLRVEVLEAEAKFLRNELKRAPLLIPAEHLRAQNDASHYEQQQSLDVLQHQQKLGL